MMTHVFTEAGLGQHPFTLIGYQELTFQAAPGEPIRAGGSCDFCGTAIRHSYRIKSSDGHTHKVGSECIKKAADKGLISEAKLAKRRADAERKFASHEAKIRKHHDAQRAAFGGLTSYDVGILLTDLNALQAQADAASRGLSALADELSDGRGGFCDSVAEGLRNGELPSGKGYWITLDILAKKAGRRNSKAYVAREKEVEKILREES